MSNPSETIMIHQFKKQKDAKPFRSHKAHRVALISISLALSQTPVYIARSWIQSFYGTNASPSVPVYVPAFTGTQSQQLPKEGWPG